MMGNSVGRRDVLKKGAVVAAAAWTAPMIVSSKVGASSGGTCQEVACSYVYVFKVEGSTACTPFQTTPCATTIQNSSALTVVQACVPGASGGYSEGSGGSVTLPPGYDVINVIGKKGPSGCVPGIGGTPTLDGQCRQTVSLPAGYSHIYVVVCSGTPLAGTPVVADESAGIAVAAHRRCRQPAHRVGDHTDVRGDHDDLDRASCDDGSDHDDLGSHHDDLVRTLVGRRVERGTLTAASSLVN